MVYGRGVKIVKKIEKNEKFFKKVLTNKKMSGKMLKRL